MSAGQPKAKKLGSSNSNVHTIGPEKNPVLFVIPVESSSGRVEGSSGKQITPNHLNKAFLVNTVATVPVLVFKLEYRHHTFVWQVVNHCALYNYALLPKPGSSA